MATPNKIELNAQKVVSAWKGLSPKIVAEIIPGIGDSTDPAVVNRVVAAVFKKYNIKQAMTEAMISSIAGSLGAGAKVKVPVNSVKMWFTEKVYKEDTKLFKASINDLSRTKEIVSIVRQGMAKGNSWRKVAQDMRTKNIQVGDVAKDVQGLIDAARQSYALTGDVKGFTAYEKEIKAVKKRISTLVDPSTSKLKAAYSEIANITDGASAAAVERAAKYAVFHKQKYNAERIARTEMARAYGQAVMTDMSENDMVIGWKWVLSREHPKTDICNFHADVDLYGMGKGAYPKNYGPELPAHPHCICLMEQIYKTETDEATPGDYSEKGAEKYLNGLSEEDRVALLGVKGADKFEENKKSWTKNLSNYGGQVKQPATVPVEVLYGK